MKHEPESINDRKTSLHELTFNRRQLYAMLAAGALGGGAAIQVFTDIPERLERKNLLDRIISEVGQNRRNAVYTLAESIAVWAGSMAVCNQMDARGISHGTHASDGELAEEFARNHPIRDYVHANCMMPLLEEAMFRLVPSALFSEEKPPHVGLHWVTGLSANTIFALIHNVGNPEAGKFTFSLDSLPLEQFILGAYCWYAQRKGGYVHAAGAHVLFNNLCSAYQQRPDFGGWSNQESG